MSHWGDDYAAITIRENRRKQLNTSAEELLTRVLYVIKSQNTRKYHVDALMGLSPDAHANNLRADILAAVKNEAHRLNVEEKA